VGSKTTTQVAEMPAFQKEFLTETLLPIAKDIGTSEYQPYTGELVAGMTPMQQQALAGYGGLTLPSEFGEATDVYRQMAQRTPEERQADISAYTQAYTSNVIDPTMAALQRQRAQARVGEEAQAIKSGAFGGDRRSVYEGERQGAFEAQMGQTLGQMQAQGYSQAVQRAAAEDAQRLKAAGLLSGQGLQGLQTEQAILAAQMGAGTAQQQQSQQELDAAYQQYLAEQNAPLTQFGVLTGAASSIPGGYGTTTQTQRDPMGAFGMGLQAFGGLGMGGMGPFSAFQGNVKSNPFSFF
jgi:hypothetical protein